MSIGLDMMNAGESSPRYGVDAPQVWSKGLLSKENKSIGRKFSFCAVFFIVYRGPTAKRIVWMWFQRYKVNGYLAIAKCRAKGSKI
jgi:hypothetical protein